MNMLKGNAVYLAWVTALLSMLGSLYFQYVAGFPPCVLCWYQRVVMYPLVLIIPIAIIRKDKNLPLFVLPFSIIGAVIAIFHNLLYYKLIPESAAPCLQGISCTTKYIEWFGFLTIPLLSLIAFVLIAILMIITLKKSPYEQRN